MLIFVLIKVIIILIIRVIKTYFKLKELNNIKYFLNINIKRNRVNYYIFLSQESFTNKILQKFIIGPINPIYIPINIK